MSGGSARLSCIRLWKSEDPLRSRFSNRLRRKFPLRFTAAEIYLLTRILETAAVFKIYGRERSADAAGWLERVRTAVGQRVKLPAA